MKRGGGSGGGGEIVEVEGGHIIRSTGRKDRHSKVFTAKGPRDRRVRLSAHTAIQFYDVQDRLGYDRPSKAVDWLITKAKNAIDKLAELPPWDPHNIAENNDNIDHTPPKITHSDAGPSGMGFEFQKELQTGTSGPGSSYILHEDDETMKSFLTMNSGMNFQSYPHEIIPRSSIQAQDLGLSLHTSNPVTFEANFSRMVGNWNSNGESRFGFFSNQQNQNQQTIPQPVFSQGSTALFSQREPLQSNYSQLIHAWEAHHHHHNQNRHQISIPNGHFTAEFHVPARIHGEEEDKPSSPPPNSHY